MIIGKNVETLLSALRDAFNRLVNGKQVVGSQTVDIISASTSKLTVPAGATEAVITLDKTAAAADAYTPLIRWSVNSVAPVSGPVSLTPGSETHGMTLMSIHGPLVLKGAESLTSFRAIAYAAGVTTGTLLLKVTYYK